jgi:hypothetical protein
LEIVALSVFQLIKDTNSLFQPCLISTGIPGEPKLFGKIFSVLRLFKIGGMCVISGGDAFPEKITPQFYCPSQEESRHAAE